MIRKDCFAFDAKVGNCRVLLETLCRKGECPFCKTGAQAEAERRKSYERRVRLGGPFTDRDNAYKTT